MFRCIVALLLTASLTLAADFNQIVEKNFDASHLKKVAVLSTNGNISIKGSKDNRIHLIATKKIKGSQSEKDRLLNSLKITTREENGVLTISVKHLKKGNGFFSWLFDLGFGDYRVDFDLTVPSRLKVKAHSTNGKIEVLNFNGELDLATTNGEIKAINVQKARELHSTNGNVAVDFEALPDFDDEFEITTTNGEINILVPREARFNVKAFTTNGRIVYALPQIGELSKSKTHLEINNGQDLVTLFLKTTNGDINIHARP